MGWRYLAISATPQGCTDRDLQGWLCVAAEQDIGRDERSENIIRLYFLVIFIFLRQFLCLSRFCIVFLLRFLTRLWSRPVSRPSTWWTPSLAGRRSPSSLPPVCLTTKWPLRFVDRCVFFFFLPCCGQTRLLLFIFLSFLYSQIHQSSAVMFQTVSGTQGMIAKCTVWCALVAVILNVKYQ